jgi:hypothetical protein
MYYEDLFVFAYQAAVYWGLRSTDKSNFLIDDMDDMIDDPICASLPSWATCKALASKCFPWTRDSLSKFKVVKPVSDDPAGTAWNQFIAKWYTYLD